MIKAHSRRKLSRTTSHRRALLRNLFSSLIIHEKLTTTLPRAKELQRFAEKLITVSKTDKAQSFRIIRRDVNGKQVMKKIYEVIAPRYGSRPGGYTQIFKLGERKGDAAPMAVIKLVQ